MFYTKLIMETLENKVCDLMFVSNNGILRNSTLFICGKHEN